MTKGTMRAIISEIEQTATDMHNAIGNREDSRTKGFEDSVGYWQECWNIAYERNQAARAKLLAFCED